MIFISYNHNDQQLVDMIARQLELSFGKNNIFYDRWSMQPGDSIIGKMNEGLEQYTTFFYFLSTSSLKSNMVAREWQSALVSSVNSGMKFIPIRLDDCNLPAIMKDLVYIDLYDIGIDEAIYQMKSVVNQESNYKPLEDKENLIATLHKKSDFEIEFEIRATMFTVHEVTFAFACDNEFDDFDIVPLNERMIYTKGVEVFKDLPNGERQYTNALLKTLQRVLTPNTPFEGVMKSKGTPLNFEGILHIISETKINNLQILWK
ncbi:TPA: toll/interleukin-1 receptor domain-containing protein [Streptococcus suis]|uniref:Toll/interleukin-1 receptor domain-containing protein n=3 Tax=Streptococcus suis TaxID=1307 RepID=A0A0Z8GUU9_STRSU|nr:toll/interleukin-1 receptor domain-containing protein [Streptococcus suis]MCQ8270820.1 toll/interleukin-1 receptor domain-containing protein [Streptococcus suis]MCQ8785329.1 toll/interleukin-1 receptor domain-containing protein [Streptococcus suis]MDW8720122.1 toll/interleukin-1 receptor domain-containing protein [Streptococcus suis]MDY7596089.1 toll/interleukin-1 receptor domain-containing protein [Streptococcus suis]MDY7601580.1 toll/interleukin-1 receptor domain-containing protein [Strep